uniref:Uncharacterized protein n=1 Tax=Anguilla anguilla TaxID=7936 RepID=A0A0E9QAC0_ANGAN
MVVLKATLEHWQASGADVQQCAQGQGRFQACLCNWGSLLNTQAACMHALHGVYGVPIGK